MLCWGFRDWGLRSPELWLCSVSPVTDIAITRSCMYLQSFVSWHSGIDQTIVSSLLSAPSVDKTTVMHLQGLLPHANPEQIIPQGMCLCPCVRVAKENVLLDDLCPFLDSFLEEFLATDPSLSERFSSLIPTFWHIPASNPVLFSYWTRTWPVTSYGALMSFCIYSFFCAFYPANPKTCEDDVEEKAWFLFIPPWCCHL